MRSAAFTHPLLLAASLVACGGPEPQDLPRLNRWSDSAIFLSHRAVWVLMVDDTPAAGALREAVAEGIEPQLAYFLEGAVGGDDPGAWSEVDWTVVLAFPSATGAARFVGPAEVPGLRVRTLHASRADIHELADVVRTELEARVAPEGAPYRPLEALADLALLLSGERTLLDHDELAIARSALDAYGVGIALLSTQDDESALGPLRHAETMRRLPFAFSLVVRPPAPASLCQGGSVAPDAAALEAPRLVAFAHEVGHGYYFDAWPCAAERIAESGPFETFHAHSSGWPFCPDRAIARDASGLPRCRAYARIDPSRGCDPTRGWRDPEDRADGERRPRVEPSLSFSGRARVCEIAPLEGDFARRCAASPACEGCPSGFCLADKDLVGPVCYGRASLERARFVGGAAEGSDALVEIVCLLDD